MEIEEIKSQIANLTSEFELLKNSITHSYGLNRELDDVRRKRRIPPETNFSVLNLLTLELKPEVTREVMGICIETSDEINTLKSDLSACQTDQKSSDDAINGILARLAKSEDDLRKTATVCEELKCEFKILERTQDEMRSEMATNSQLGDLKTALSKYTTLSKFKDLRAIVDKCAPNSELDLVKHQQERVKSKFKKYQKQEPAEKNIQNVKSSILSYLDDKFYTKQNADGFSARFDKYVRKTDDRIKDIAEISGKVDDKVRENFRIYKSEMESKP